MARAATGLAAAGVSTLRAGPAARVDGASIIPISRLTSVRVAGRSTWAALVPVAVVVVRNHCVQVWNIDGSPSSLHPWRTALPELTALIANASASEA